jgi:alpha-beta hydrolase superfamily lysophospholipase
MTPTPWRTVPLTDDYGLPGRRPPGATDPTAYLRTVEVLGADVHHLDLPGPTPDAPVVLLVHGLGGRWQHWTENLAGLAEHARVVALDLPGFGRSSPPRGGYAVDGFADVVAALARELALPPVTVVGHSLGGWWRCAWRTGTPTRCPRSCWPVAPSAPSRRCWGCAAPATS